MSQFLRSILRILDGSPRSLQVRRQSGQSLLEMALVTPLLIIMIVGMVEIGWYANNYLTLLEVTRVGARTGTVLVGELSPQNWDETATLHPDVLAHMGITGDQVDRARNFRNCDLRNQFSGFYNFVACIMLDSLEPLILKDKADGRLNRIVDEDGAEVFVPHLDDIAISLFSLQAVNNDDPSLWAGDPVIFSRTYDFEANVHGDTDGLYPDGPSVIVVGRYPRTANECNMWQAGGVETQVDERQPFDYIVNGVVDGLVLDGVLREWELEEEDTTPEYQRGFVWTGQHRVVETDELGRELVCWGSNFTLEDVEVMMNTPGFIPDSLPESESIERRLQLPSQGVILVEMFWDHDLLLNFPFFPTIIQMFGDDTQEITISVWAAFPLPSVEPNVVFDLP